MAFNMKSCETPLASVLLAEVQGAAFQPLFTCLQEVKVSKKNKEGVCPSRTLRTLALSPRAKTADRFLRASLLREKMPEMRESSTPMRSFLVVMSSCSFSSSPMYVRKYALSTCTGGSLTQRTAPTRPCLREAAVGCVVPYRQAGYILKCTRDLIGHSRQQRRLEKSSPGLSGSSRQS
jgi:hypothetical protein